MPNCPNCGEIVMNGDPYCPHCGTTFRWVEDEYEMRTSRNTRSIETRLNDIPITSFYSSLNSLNEPDYIIKGIKDSLNVSKVRNATVSIYQPFPRGDLEITFKRQNKYFSTIDRVKYDCISNKISGYYFLNYHESLKNADWFKRAIKQKESETGLEFYDCGGGYDANWDWYRTNIFELREGYEVVAHFIKNEYSYLTFEVDFKNHRLMSESETMDRATPYDLVADYDWV